MTATDVAGNLGADPSNRASPASGCSIAVVILTFNEALHIRRAIESVRSFAGDILVVDSHSTDATVALAEAAGARVLQHRFVNQARQFQWAMDHGDITADWVLRLDADEVIEPDLQRALIGKLPSLPADVSGVNFARKHIFMGRWVRRGGRYPLYLLRLWRNGLGRVEDRWMDEHVVISSGRTIILKGGFADINLKDLTAFTDKHNSYATREAIEVLSRRYGLLERDGALSSRSNSRQAATKRKIKEKLYNALPLWAGPLGYFLYRYILQLGFLDGREGLIYHVLQGFWYRFLVAAKIEEFDRVLRKCPDRQAKIEALSRMSGYDLSAQDDE